MENMELKEKIINEKTGIEYMLMSSKKCTRKGDYLIILYSS